MLYVIRNTDIWQAASLLFASWIDAKNATSTRAEGKYLRGALAFKVSGCDSGRGSRQVQGAELAIVAIARWGTQSAGNVWWGRVSYTRLPVVNFSIVTGRHEKSVIGRESQVVDLHSRAGKCD